MDLHKIAHTTLVDTSRIYLINGPNLNLLGTREPHIYGTLGLSDIEAHVKQALDAKYPQATVVLKQSNSEAEIITWLQAIALSEEVDLTEVGLVLNCGALTHTSIAIRDALLMCKPAPMVEVHLSNTFARESFRHKSMTADVVDGVIAGLGWRGYLAACEWILSR